MCFERFQNLPEESAHAQSSSGGTNGWYLNPRSRRLAAGCGGRGADDLVLEASQVIWLVDGDSKCRQARR